jgi:hypothetical protein
MSIPNKPTVRRSHVVPRFYLRGFCEPLTDRLWVGDIRLQKCYCANITNVAVEKDFYASEAGAHEDDLEHRLSKIESEAAPKLKEFTLNVADVSPELGRFIAWLAARVTWLRRVTEEQFPAFVSANQQSLQKLAVSETRPFEFEHEMSGKRERLSLADALARINDKSWRLRVTQDQHLDAIRLQAHLFLSEHFPRMKWVRASAPYGYRFVTSDRPVSWDIMGAGVGDYAAALRHPLAELTLPMTAAFALVAGHDHSAILARPWQVDEINQRTAAAAERFIYGPTEEDVSALIRLRSRDRLQ